MLKLSDEKLALLESTGPELTEEECKELRQSMREYFWNLRFPQTIGPEDDGVHLGPKFENWD